MKPYTAQFLEHRTETTWHLMLGAYKFVPHGRTAWLQRLAWRFLTWRAALAPAYEPKITVTQHLIDADKFIENIIRQKRALFDGFRKEGQRLLIGSEDYAELMSSPEVREHHFAFQAEVGMGRSIVGLTVEVIPWMRGAVVMP